MVLSPERSQTSLNEHELESAALTCEQSNEKICFEKKLAKVALSPLPKDFDAITRPLGL